MMMMELLYLRAFFFLRVVSISGSAASSGGMIDKL
jgi:hypothetical protein